MSWSRIKDPGVKLEECPFCHGGDTFFAQNGHLITINHQPAAGVVCPARMEQVCDSIFQGHGWWNNRSTKGEK